MISKKIIFFCSAAAIITLIFGTIYGTVQQSYRQSANDPQIQWAEDGSVQLKAGNVPSQLGAGQVDIKHSLAPFMIVYNQHGDEVASSGKLEGQTPELPMGVLSHAHDNHQNRVTWEPASDVRIAAVVSNAGANGYVLAGRNLREVESREAKLTITVAFGWFLSMVVLIITWLLARVATKN